jgi:ATP-binding protein involved in chromosome partitioning
MTKNEINDILKKINYPGFSRDIVSFGMVKEISISDNEITIILQINSDNKNILNQLASEIKNELSNFSKKIIKINITTPAKESSNENQIQSSINLQSIKHVKNTIAIASGKGGVGKSTVSINLASELSKNYKVGVLDLDIYGPSLPMLIGENKQPDMTSEKKLIPIKKYNMELMSFGFINNQNAPTVWRGPMVSRMVQQFFDDVEWGKLDFLILDLPPGTGDIQLTLVQKIALTGAIIVTTPQELALLDVKKGADMFEKVNTPVIGVIENMTHFLCPNCNESSKIFPGTGGDDESSRLNVPLLGKIHLSPELAISADEGVPYVLKHKSSPITLEYEKIAQHLKQLATPNS